jgi:uncharacterized protein involved in response to NO
MIEHSMLVSEISRQYPQCRPVFEKYGIAGCGGADGPPEPLFIFAAAHRVPLPELVNELNQAVRGEWREEPKVQEIQEVESETLYKRFIFGALFVALTAGFGLGVVNLTRIAFEREYYSISGALKQAHGHAQLFGFIGLFVMGVALHAVPRFKMVALKSVRSAKICFALMFAGVLLRAVSQPLAQNRLFSFAVAASGALEFGAIGIFLWLFIHIFARSKQRAEFYEKFVWASVAWLALLGAWNFVLAEQIFLRKSAGIPALSNILFVHVALFGFIANMIFGFSFRILPHFLGLREPSKNFANTGFVLWNAAIFLRYPLENLAKIASVLELLGAIFIIAALKIFMPRRTKIEISGVDNTFSWFIKLGYAWLLAAAALPFHADIFRLAPSSRHAMAVGFITPIIFGVAYRVLPIFNGVNLASNKLMRVSFWHFAAGSTLSISMALNRAYGWTWTYAWSGIAGWLVFAATVMFAWNLLQTLRVKAEKFTRDSAVKLTTRVAELLEIYPDLRPVLIHGGLAGLAAMRHNPPRFVTIEFAARRHGIEPQPLIEILNEEIQKRKSK